MISKRHRNYFGLGFLLISSVALAVVVSFFGDVWRQTSIANNLIRNGGEFETDLAGNVSELKLFSISKGGLQQVARLSKLKHVQIDDSTICDLAVLHQCKSLESLTLVDCTADCEQKLFQLNVKQISLRGKSTELINRIEGFDAVKKLNLICTDPLSSTFSATQIPDFKELTSLALVGLELVDMTSLAKFRKLEKLSLYGSSVGGEIHFVKQFPLLRELELTGVRVEEYDALRNLSFLEELTVDRQSFSSDDVNRIQAWLPNCRILLL